LACRDRGDDDLLRHRSNAGTDRGRRDTDAFGSLSYALNVSAALLAIGAIGAAFQRKLTKPAG